MFSHGQNEARHFDTTTEMSVLLGAPTEGFMTVPIIADKLSHDHWLPCVYQGSLLQLHLPLAPLL